MIEEVIFTQEGQIGLITLNRASALNALSLPMIQAMQKQLELWKDDNTVKAIVIRAVPGNAFCAGGDVRWLYNSGRSEDSQQMQFFWHEYRLNHYIYNLGKPYIALMDGITMGGGVGISLHGSHPIASEQFVFAMPETGIGFFPDIGASHLLTRCPGSLGIYLGLTGNRIGAQDAFKAELIKYLVPSAQMKNLLAELINTDLSEDSYARVDQCIKEYTVTSFDNEISQIKPLIDVCFSQPTVDLIVDSLMKRDGIWAEGVYNTLMQKSPLSLKITLTQLQKAKGISLAECLKMDFDLVAHFMRDSDFYEGVRSLLIVKDKKPNWKPSRLDLVSDSLIVNYFERFHSGLELIVV